MRQYEQPPTRIMRLHNQPDFPTVDLDPDNTEMLKYILGRNKGLEAYAAHIQEAQRVIHQIANRAAVLLGMHTRYNPAELQSFSHGFAGFDTISDLVHPPRVYTFLAANERVAHYLVDTRSEVLMAAEEILSETRDEELVEEESEVIRIDDGEEYAKYRMELTPAMEDSLRGVPTTVVAGGDRMLANPEKLFTEFSHVLPEQLPNTFDVVVHMGEVRGESGVQLQMRIAGAGLARTLQTLD